jgi:ABC-type transporter Mla subunit MlaD
MLEANPKSAHWPTYALRAWMTALLGQMERARDDLDTRVEAHEKELARLRAQKERSNMVIESLRAAVASVDNVLRGTRDSELQREQEQVRRQRDQPQESKGELKRETHEKPQSPERAKS